MLVLNSDEIREILTREAAIKSNEKALVIQSHRGYLNA